MASTTVRTLLAHEGALARGALAFLLSRDPGIDVVAEVAYEVEDAVRRHGPHVAVVDLDLIGPDGMPVAWALHHRAPGVALLVLAEARRSSALGHAMAADLPGTGFVAKDSTPEALVAAVHAVARGEPVRDATLLMAATRAGSPLTPREQEVLWVAANGRPVREIAATLRLSCGTVQNHLSRIISKTGSHSRVQAVRVARDAGWI